MGRVNYERKESSNLKQSLKWRKNKMLKLQIEMNETEAEIDLLNKLIKEKEAEEALGTENHTVYIIHTGGNK